MKEFTHVATSSKLLLTLGFFCEADAASVANRWNDSAPVGAHDAESSAARWT